MEHIIYRRGRPTGAKAIPPGSPLWSGHPMTMGERPLMAAADGNPLAILSRLADDGEHRLPVWGPRGE